MLSELQRIRILSISRCILSFVLGTIVAYTLLAWTSNVSRIVQAANISRLDKPRLTDELNSPMPTPNITLTGEIIGESFGNSVSHAGDINNDGFIDVIVGAQGYNQGQGRVFVFLGTPNGLSSSPATNLSVNQEFSRFGTSIDTAGDINGDTFDDTIVGAPGRHYQGDWGHAYIFTGTVNGLGTTPAFTLTGEFAGDMFGYSVGTAGDVNNDGFSDVIVGAMLYPSGTVSSQGRAHVYLGSPDGIIITPTFSVTGESNTWFGCSVGTAGDINLDGYSDVIVGAQGKLNTPFGKGYAQIFTGSAYGLDYAPAYTLTGETPGDAFGYSVGTAGDINNDGFSDIIVGSPFYPNNSGVGRAYVYTATQSGINDKPDFMVTGESSRSLLGLSIATAGDINGDSYSDIIIGSPDYDDGVNGSLGRTYIYLGSNTGLRQPPAIVAHGSSGGDFGISLNTTGDLNRDGFADYIVGATEWGNPGRAYIYFGSSTIPRAIDDTAQTTEDETAIINVAANDYDFDGNLDLSSTNIITPPIYGNTVNYLDGTISFTPALNYFGADQFIYEICDTDNQCDTGIVFINIAPILDSPQANNDYITTTQDTDITFDITNNDFDPDGDLDPSSLSILSIQLNGMLTNNRNGTVTYSPPPGYNGSGSFIYQICDTTNICDNATVGLTVIRNLPNLFLPIIVR